MVEGAFDCDMVVPTIEDLKIAHVAFREAF